MHRWKAIPALFAVILTAVPMSIAQSSATVSAAGSDAAGAPLPAQLLTDTPASGCPVAMHAQQRGGGTSFLIAGDGPRQSVRQGVRLTLNARGYPARIVSAQVTVHGPNGKPHAVASGSNFGYSLPGMQQYSPWETTKTLSLNFEAGEDHSADADVAMSGFTAIRWIRLDSLTFADGTVWIPGDNVVCRTAPDPFVLVSGR